MNYISNKQYMQSLSQYTNEVKGKVNILNCNDMQHILYFGIFSKGNYTTVDKIGITNIYSPFVNSNSYNIVNFEDFVAVMNYICNNSTSNILFDTSIKSLRTMCGKIFSFFDKIRNMDNVSKYRTLGNFISNPMVTEDFRNLYATYLLCIGMFELMALERTILTQEYIYFSEFHTGVNHVRGCTTDLRSESSKWSKQDWIAFRLKNSSNLFRVSMPPIVIPLVANSMEFLRTHDIQTGKLVSGSVALSDILAWYSTDYPLSCTTFTLDALECIRKIQGEVDYMDLFNLPTYKVARRSVINFANQTFYQKYKHDIASYGIMFNLELNSMKDNIEENAYYSSLYNYSLLLLSLSDWIRYSDNEVILVETLICEVIKHFNDKYEYLQGIKRNVLLD